MSPSVMRACSMPLKKFCKDKKLGDGTAWTCLQEHADEDAMPTACKDLVQKHTVIRNKDIRFDTAMAQACRADIAELCQDVVDTRDRDGKARKFQMGGEVIECLIEHRAEVKNPNCKSRVNSKARERMSDVRNDVKTNKACETDIAMYCHDVEGKGKGLVHACLEKNIMRLSDECRAREFAAQKLKSQDVKFNPRMAKDCSIPIAKFCRDVKNHDQGEVISCLIEHVDETDMPVACRTHLKAEERKRAKTIEFNPELYKACKTDLERLYKEKLCKSKVPQKGKTDFMGDRIKCLTEQRRNIKAPECRSALLKRTRSESADYRAKPGMEDACRQDIEKFCKSEQGGAGRMQACLRRHSKELTESCAAMVVQVKKAESDDATVNFSVRKNCVNEVKTFCKDAPHGDKRLLTCLKVHDEDEGFSESCKKALNEVDINPALVSAQKKALKRAVEPNLQKTGAADSGSFLEMRGGMALLGLGAICLVAGYGLYTLYNKHRVKSGGYTVVIPKNMNA